ncbi:Calcium-binding EF-hand family protein [Zea mays]|uniref:Calcium-binding EF-hand family protein n=1 Tax=Zea mays TaxID=4577 RepID=A0A1D6GS24_MAIZE|nr:Calcium-binding EF-hand family protein [Zea mays]
MAAGLKRDPIVILRINGEDLSEFVESPRYEPEAVAIFSQAVGGPTNTNDATLRQCLLAAVGELTIDHGMPPASDPWVIFLKTAVEFVLRARALIFGWARSFIGYIGCIICCRSWRTSWSPRSKSCLLVLPSSSTSTSLFPPRKPFSRNSGDFWAPSP